MVETRAIVAPPGGLQALAAILSRLPDVPPSPDDCRLITTDAPRGTLVLSGGASGGAKTYRFDTGCRDRESVEFVDTLKQADALVGTWAKAGKLISKQSVPTRF